MLLCKVLLSREARQCITLKLIWPWLETRRPIRQAHPYPLSTILPYNRTKSGLYVTNIDLAQRLSGKLGWPAVPRNVSTRLFFLGRYWSIGYRLLEATSVECTSCRVIEATDLSSLVYGETHRTWPSSTEPKQKVAIGFLRFYGRTLVPGRSLVLLPHKRALRA